MMHPAEYYQRDRRIHPPALTPDYKTSVARSPRLALSRCRGRCRKPPGRCSGMAT